MKLRELDEGGFNEEGFRFEAEKYFLGLLETNDELAALIKKWRGSLFRKHGLDFDINLDENRQFKSEFYHSEFYKNSELSDVNKFLLGLSRQEDLFAPNIEEWNIETKDIRSGEPGAGEDTSNVKWPESIWAVDREELARKRAENAKQAEPAVEWPSELVDPEVEKKEQAERLRRHRQKLAGNRNNN